MSGLIWGYGTLAQGLTTYFVGLDSTEPHGEEPFNGVIEMVDLHGSGLTAEELQSTPLTGEFYFTRTADGRLGNLRAAWCSGTGEAQGEQVTAAINAFETERTVH